MAEYADRVFENYLHPDVKKKYKITYDEDGKEIIDSAILSFEKMLKVAKDKIKSPKMMKKGLDIYIKKNNKNSKRTWTEQEYKHPGFQYHYLFYKSLQRYTEVYNLCVLAFNKGLIPNKKLIKVVALGGGPGFELLAFRDFLAKHQPHSKVTMITMDPVDWSEYSNAAGIKYIKYMIGDNIGFDFDVSILSYVAFAHVKTADKVADIGSMFFKNNMKLLLINSRVRNLYCCNKFIVFGYILHFLHKSFDTRLAAVTLKDHEKGSKAYVKLPFHGIIY